MKKAISGISIALAFVFLVASCGPKTVREVTIKPFHATRLAISAAFTMEHQLCDPSVPVTQPVFKCTEIAHALKLTDAKHQELSQKFTDLMDKELLYGNRLQTWLASHAANEPLPSSSDLRSGVALLSDFIKAMGGAPELLALLRSVDAVTAAINDTERLIRGGTIPVGYLEVAHG
jgi:hypothetical protein